ncbi:MAG: iron-sulfur cluster assembly accessory protein [Haemophilus parainfluenzae]|nr:iron-sulfur cluster assembly accessory protein [Haemophilus parainfluenzae]
MTALYQFKDQNMSITLTASGCSGLGYVLEFVDVLNDDDLIFEQHGVKVVVDPKSLVYLDGIELDYVKEGLNEGFKYKSCGCGESFHV